MENGLTIHRDYSMHPKTPGQSDGRQTAYSLSRKCRRNGFTESITGNTGFNLAGRQDIQQDNRTLTVGLVAAALLLALVWKCYQK